MLGHGAAPLHPTMTHNAAGQVFSTSELWSHSSQLPNHRCSLVLAAQSHAPPPGSSEGETAPSPALGSTRCGTEE